MNLLSPNNLLMTIVLVFLTIVLAIIVIPFLIIVAICCLFSYIVMGISSVFFNNHKRRRHDGIYEGPYRNQPQDNATSPVVHDDGSIECEVISVQTVEKDENTPDALH